MAEAIVPTKAASEQPPERARLIAPYPMPEPRVVAGRNAAIVDEWRFSGIGHEALAAKHEMAPEDVLALLERARRRMVPGRNLLIFEDWTGKRLGLKGLAEKYDVSQWGIRAILRDQWRGFNGGIEEVRGCGDGGGVTGSILIK